MILNNTHRNIFEPSTEDVQCIKCYHTIQENFSIFFDLGSTNKTFTKTFEGNRSNFTVVDLLGDNEQSFVICAYTLLFMIAAFGNLAIFVTLIRTGRKKSRVNLMMLHLSLADLIVTFILMPTEIFWRITQQWLAGNFLCKFLFMMRAFGLYLSSNILICISFDRYFAVIHPLRVSAARKRSKIMLLLAWLVACFCSLPQVLVFHVEVHPNVTDFKQCVSFNYFSSMEYETVYNMSCLSAMYFIPLLVIICTYSRIFLEINMNSRDVRDDSAEKRGEKGKMRLRRSDLRLMQRARSRTLRLTLNIVLVFLVCGMPYAVMTTYYMFNVEAAKKVDIRIQEVCFLMVASNSCMNPLVYGTYIINLKRIIWKAVNCFFCGQKAREVPDKSIVGSALSRSSLRVKTIQTQRDNIKVREVYKLKTLHKNFAPPPEEPSTCHSGVQSEPPLRTQCESEFCVEKLTTAKSWENFDYWSANRSVR